MIKLKIHQLDPYHPALGLLVPQVGQRLLESTKPIGDEDANEKTILGIMSRLYEKDPTVIMLAGLDDKGHVKAHAVASIEQNGAFMLQPRVDEPTDDDTIGRFIAIVEQWVLEYNKDERVRVGQLASIPGLTLVARRSDPKWAKKYGFETQYYVMFRNLKGE